MENGALSLEEIEYFWQVIKEKKGNNFWQQTNRKENFILTSRSDG